MKRLLVVALAVVATGAFAPVAHAAPGPNDPGCGFVGTTDETPGVPDGVVSGVLFGGPVTQSGTLTCTVQVGTATHAGAAPSSASESATSAIGVTALAPVAVSFEAPPRADLYLCDRFADGTTTWVWDGATSVWVDLAANPDATCVRAAGTSDEVDPAIRPIIDFIHAIEDFARENHLWPNLDPPLCPIFMVLQGDYGVATINSQGDVFLLGDPFWDCPPYDLEPPASSGGPEAFVAYHPPESLS